MHFTVKKYFRCDVVRRSNRAVSQRSPIFLPTLRPPLAVHLPIPRKVGWFGLTQISVEFGSVRLFESGTESKVGQLDVTPRVQK